MGSRRADERQASCPGAKRHGFSDGGLLDSLGAVEVGDRARDAEHAGVAAGTEMQSLGGGEQPVVRFTRGTVRTAQDARGGLCVSVHLGMRRESRVLAGTRGETSLINGMA